MKRRIILLAAMSFTMVGFAQKNELKAADKALKSGDSMAAKASLEAASTLVEGADAKVKAQYEFLRGKTYADLAKKGNQKAYEEAVASFEKVLKIEEESGKSKYSSETKSTMTAMTADLVNSAVADNGAKKYKMASEKLYLSYRLSPKDTSYLYYAASSAVNGGHYEDALTYYNKLQELGFDGSRILYKATKVENGEVVAMEKKQRDLMVKSGTYKDPIEEKEPSKKAEIVKNTALIYTQLGQDEKALEAYKTARLNNPKDVNLIVNQANLYFKLGDKDMFKNLMAEAIEIAPNNPDLHYNIGVITMEQGKLEEARTSFRKTLELKPEYTNAQLNLSTTYVNEGNGLIDEMNSLGNSRSDIARYEVLKEQKDAFFKKGAGVLESALETSPDNKSILTQLKNIYGAMGDNENYLRLKKILGE